MKIVHLINAHKNLPQLERLVARLSHDNAVFFIHLDRKVADAEVAGVTAATARYNVHFVTERVAVGWGGFSQVEAILNGLREVLQSGIEFDYLNFLSGQDYPLQCNDSLLQFLEESRGSEFMEYCELSRYGFGTELYRYEKYHLTEKILVSCTLRRWIERFLNRALPVRTAPLGYQVYAGSSWWTITAHCARYIRDFLERNSEYARFFATTRSADEMFFQTIVMNSPFREQVLNRNLHYLDWSEHGRSPKSLTGEDFLPMLASGRFFARKFDMETDATVLDMLDDHLAVESRRFSTGEG